MIRVVIRFLQDDLWRIRVRQVSPAKAFGIKFLRIVLTSIRRFADNNNQLQASALTYYTLLSIVPVLAAIFGIAQGFGIKGIVQTRLHEQFEDHQEVLAFVVSFAERLLDQPQGGLIAGVGIAVLFWSVIKVLGHIETAFNGIWNVKKTRSWMRRISDYLSMIVILPVLLAVGSGLTVFISRGATPLAEAIFLKPLPYIITWTLFSIVYIFLPNTRVPVRSAIFGGVLAGTAYQFVQWAYIKFQIGVTAYGAVYGSFAALPLFLIWLQISWLIVLSGAEVCYASQHVAAWEFKHDIGRISPSFRQLLSLLVCHRCYSGFHSGERPINAVQVSDDLEIPISLTKRLVTALVDAGLVMEVSSAEGPAYVPGKPVSTVTVKDALDALQHAGTAKIPVRQSAVYRGLQRRFDEFDAALTGCEANTLLLELDRS